MGLSWWERGIQGYTSVISCRWSCQSIMWVFLTFLFDNHEVSLQLVNINLYVTFVWKAADNSGQDKLLETLKVEKQKDSMLDMITPSPETSEPVTLVSTLCCISHLFLRNKCLFSGQRQQQEEGYWHSRNEGWWYIWRPRTGSTKR